jgi:hypothetical protein
MAINAMAAAGLDDNQGGGVLMKEKRLGVKEEDGGRWFYCALIASFKEGEAWEMEKRPAAARLTRAGEVKGDRLEVGGGPDMWARFVGGREERGESGGGPRPGWWAGRREADRVRLGQAGRKGKGERVGVFFQTLFSFLFKPFQTQNVEIELFSNFSRFLKHFKASHQQTKTSCIQIMMCKHLLLLNY